MSDSNYVELTIDPGTDYSTSIAINDEATGLLKNVQSYIVTSNLKRSLVATNAYASFTCTISDDPGTIVLSMTASQTANLKPGAYFFDVKVNDSGQTSKLMEGIVFVSYGIT